MTRRDATAPPTSPKQRRLRKLWFVIIGGSALAGMTAALLDERSGGARHVKLSKALIGDASIPPQVAAVMLAALAATAIASFFYYRSIDEHDRSAQEYASLVSLNTYVFLFLGWYVAAKGSLTPSMNHGAVFVAVVATFVVTWLWRRYR